MENGSPPPTNGVGHEPRDGASSSSPPHTSGDHGRSPSGATTLSRFPTLHTTSKEKSLALPLIGQSSVTQREGVSRDHAMAIAMRQPKTRKRKGSLRKTALLGTGIMRLDRRPPATSSMNSLDSLQRSPPSSLATDDDEGSAHSSVSDFNLSPGNTSSQTDVSESIQGPLAFDTLTIDTNPSQDHSPPSTLTSPVSRYASTTDDDDGLSFSPPTVTSAADLTRRRSARSALGQATSLAVVATEITEHNYNDTEWWGWIILIATWIVFVVGMGSCLGVWSWAWDVGETPYAPPELEDDPTLPIVGYYPALIILTAVMAWVWVVVAWIGMKYFRHARFVDGEE